MLTRSDMIRLFRERGFRPRRRLGQNFVVDPNFLRSIVRRAGVTASCRVVEIGGGTGQLTCALAGASHEVWSFEKDPALFEIGSGVVAGYPNVHFIHADGLRFSEWLEGRSIDRTVSNLPYAGHEDLLIALLFSTPAIPDHTVMIQREAALRIAAPCGDRAYGALGALLQAFYEIEFLSRVPPDIFHPAPRVESALLRLRRRAGAPAIDPRRIPAILHRLKRFFAAGRKMLRTALRAEGELDTGLAGWVQRFGETRVQHIEPESLVTICGLLTPA